MTLTAEQEAEVVAITLVVLVVRRVVRAAGPTRPPRTTTHRKAPVVLRAAHTTKDDCIQRGTTVMRPALQGCHVTSATAATSGRASSTARLNGIPHQRLASAGCV